MATLADYLKKLLTANSEKLIYFLISSFSMRTFGIIESESLFKKFNWIESLSSVWYVIYNEKLLSLGNHSLLF